MPTITSIKQQKRNPSRYNLYFNGKFTLGIDEAMLIEKRLKVGQELTEIEVQDLHKIASQGKLLEQALNYLKYRPRSQREMESFLNQKIRQKRYRFDSDQERDRATQRVISRLEQLRLIDDFSFGQWWVEQRQKGRKPRGQWLIRSELKQKGLNPDTVERLLKPIGPKQELDLALQAARKHFFSQLSGNREVERPLRGKIKNYLARRGFDYHIAQEVVEKLLEER